MNVQDIRDLMFFKYDNEDFVIDKTGSKVIELVGASFIADQPYIFRQQNTDYITREIEWYNSQSLDVNDIPPPVPKIWKDVADTEGLINSNYGFLIYSEENNYQFKRVLAELKEHPNSRRAVMIYTRPSVWDEYNLNGRSDFICTSTVQYLIRKGKLEVIVQMRSNDITSGYNNDVAWQNHVQERLCEKLNVEPGNIHWQVGSLHMYESNFYCLRCLKEFNIYPKSLKHYRELQRQMKEKGNIDEYFVG